MKTLSQVVIRLSIYTPKTFPELVGPVPQIGGREGSVSADIPLTVTISW